MSLRIIYGRAGSGKTYFCLDEMKKNILNGASHPLFLLVPEQFTLSAERELITVLGTGGILGTEVLSFRRLAFRIFNEAGGITYPHIHQAGKCMIIHSILNRIGKDFKVFPRSAAQRGFVNKISSLITEFKRYSVTPELLMETCDALPGDDPLRLKLQELIEVYQAFEETLAERYRDTDDDLTLAAEKLAYTSLFDGAEIWIDGFDGFTPQEYKIIDQLAKRAKRINITLCMDTPEKDGIEHNDIFSPVKGTYRKLIKIADDNNIAIETVPVHNSDTPPIRFRNSRELAHLEQNLFAYPHRTYREKTRDIVLYSSKNIFSEVEAAAEDIVRLCRDCGLRYRDIAVVTGDLDGYFRLIEIVFAEYGIPYFIDRKVDITSHPLINLILSVLDIFQENWSYESVFRYLKTGMTGIDADRIDRLENYVLASGIRGSRWIDEKDWTMSPEMIPGEKDLEKYEDLLKDVNETRKLVTAPLIEFRNSTRGRRNASAFCAALYDFLCNLGLPERIGNNIEEFKREGKLELASEYSQVWNIVMEVFDQTVEVMGEEVFGITRFSELLKTAFAEYKIGLIPASLDQVLVGNIERSKSRGIKALYVLGANDGIFPHPAVEEGILSDSDRQMLGEKGIELAGDTRTRAFDEQYLIYRALTTAGNYLRISWSIADHEGRAMRPSMTISRLRRLFPAVVEESNIIDDSKPGKEIEHVSARTPAFGHMITAFRRKADGKECSPVWEEVYRWFVSQKEWHILCRKAQEAFNYRNVAVKVGEEKITGLYGNPVITSVSRLEQFASCPYSFYIQYGLRAQERRVYELRPHDVGTFIHEAIERFSKSVFESGVSWRDFDREWCSGKVSEIVDEMLEGMQGRGIAASKRYTILALRLKRVIARAAWLIAEHIRRSGFYPVDYEAAFGEYEKYPPIIIKHDSGLKISMRGRIDRIDKLETEQGTYLRIIDYKSGAKDFSLSDAYYGLQIQLIAYLDAIRTNSENTGQPVIPGGILYFKVDDPLIKADGKATQEEIDREVMKKLKMRGLLLRDLNVIKEMDRTINGSSLIIPASINKGDVIGKNTSAATPEQFEILQRHVRRLLKRMCNEIVRGNYPIKPYKKKRITSCKYCSFLPVCQFDPTLNENSYRFIHDRNSDEVWDMMSKEGSSDGR